MISCSVQTRGHRDAGFARRFGGWPFGPGQWYGLGSYTAISASSFSLCIGGFESTFLAFPRKSGAFLFGRCRLICRGRPTDVQPPGERSLDAPRARAFLHVPSPQHIRSARARTVPTIPPSPARPIIVPPGRRTQPRPPGGAGPGLPPACSLLVPPLDRNGDSAESPQALYYTTHLVKLFLQIHLCTRRVCASIRGLAYWRAAPRDEVHLSE